MLRRFVINRVMCLLRLDLRRGGAALRRPQARRDIEASLRARRRRAGRTTGWSPSTATLLRVLPLGQLLVRNVAMLFDAYLARHAGEKQTFSRTV